MTKRKRKRIVLVTNLPVAVDFETHAIDGNPILNPPAPVGVAIQYPGKAPDYMPMSNKSIGILTDLWASGQPMVFHNAPFDLSVARTHLNLPFPKWENIHDTMFLCYLADPYAESLSLKPSAERYLDIPPVEQDALRDWIVANVPGATVKNFGAHISKAPFEIVSPYAKADVIDTLKLWEYLHPQYGGEAYDRERQLMPILVAATVRGVRLARGQVEQALGVLEQAHTQCGTAIGAYLGVAGLNVSSGPQLAQALSDADAVTGWDLTPKGARSTAKDSMIKYIKDPILLHHLRYYNTLKTYLGTFLEPWYEMSKMDGRLHPGWNQIRSTEGQRRGTRTGRLSSDRPNFQNPPNPAGLTIPEGLPEIPDLRNYILPEEGHVWIKRDWSAQEIRILAHFEDGDLAAAFRANPRLDPHAMAKKLIYEITGRDYERKFVKETGFGMIYGMGGPGLAKKINKPESYAREIQSAYLLAMPGVKKMQKGTKARGYAGKPIRTWGGREYYTEPPKMIDGTYRTFEYKLLNYLIQGSAGDQCKQSIIDWDAGKGSAVFMATVHDEINTSVPEDKVKENMGWLQATMEQDYFDVPMLSDGFVGPSWGELVSE